MIRLFRSAAWRVSGFACLTLVLMLVCCASAFADTWSTGQEITYTQTDWGNGGSAATTLADNFLTVYPTSIVITGQAVGGFAMIFDNAGSISQFLPASGTPGALDSSLLDPESSSAGVFGGEVLALQLDVDFSQAGIILGSSGIPFGDLVIEDYAPLPSVNGLTVSELLTDANMALADAPSPFTVDQLQDLVASLTVSFDGGTPAPVAQDILVAPGGTSGGGGGMTPTPEPSSALLFVIGLLGFGMLCYKRRIDRAPS